MGLSASPTRLHDPKARDARYGPAGGAMNGAQYLLDLHDTESVFDFCGGMLFQLVLTDKLRAHLADVAQGGRADARQPFIFDASTTRMAKMPEYSQTAAADNVMLFHGREVRQAVGAAGGMRYVLCPPGTLSSLAASQVFPRNPSEGTGGRAGGGYTVALQVFDIWQCQL